MKKIKYPLVAIINILAGIVMLLGLANRSVVSISSLLTIVLLLILGFFGVFYVIKFRNSLDEEEPEQLNSWYDLAKFVDILLIIALIIRIYVFQPYIVDGHSMEPTFHGNEFLLVDRLNYRFKEPQRGEIIIFHPQSAASDSSYQVSYIKRIIGLPGESIRIADGNVYINDKELNEPYLNGLKTITENPEYAQTEVKLGPDEYFVMGDNRSNSSDSRIIGPVKKDSFVGRAYIVLYPFAECGIINHRVKSLVSFK